MDQQPLFASNYTTSKSLILLPFLGLIMLLSGCEQTLNLNDAQGKIKDELAKQTGLEVKSVNCSGQVKVKAGETFECKADTNAGNIPITAKLQDDKGLFAWNTQNFVNLKVVEDSIQKGLKEQVKVDVTANCGDPKYKVAKAGDTFKCQVEDKQKNKKDVEVAVKDNEGNISWKLTK
ncbi:DUF4333 domain-containing protein [Merismopedia glauca]|uniref:DUF4333 domain-containing protein n=1 Tax=Merismopedia glauca CCAP 1448/3 TaxID=1296344 RepID=A0A2T1CA61_9CYAN|nr:DUF4333 domain-containing protein [Merismopedia glauca]PSB05129.1 hypothetical protein C7B64_01105 [Merismopedia glauca CCAP 1448/3]